MDPLTLKAILLGIIEGLTEYLPVSSTGHLLLAEHFLGLNFDDATLDKTFTVLVQLGSILALVIVYLRRLLAILLAAGRDRESRLFIFGVLIAFLPAAMIGAGLHSFIKTVLFNPMIVCISLIAGGFILLLVDELPLERKYHEATRFPLSMAFKIGLFQCLAMIPGVSRSGATIVGAMALGADKRAAAEFSFFLAIPTMVGAFTFDLLKSYKDLTFAGTSLIAIGFVAAFISGLLVVTSLLRYVSRHGFALFAWWRIVVGAAGLAGLLVFG